MGEHLQYDDYGEEVEEDYAEPSYAKRQKLVRTMHLAIAGCSHGEMDKIYETLKNIEGKRNIKFDLLICCGDFQAVRNYNDLHHVNVPPKYRHLMTFHKYYSGEAVAPILTIFVGGNHESSGYLGELPNGGWAAPNIYYMGHASVIRVGGLRIAGLSGIFKANDYERGHFERPPFNDQSLRSVYHVRSVDIFRLKQLKTREESSSKVDVVISHDWPAGITDFGDLQSLLNVKPYFRNDIENNQLGNPATMDLLHELKPRRWFSAHMHVKFEAEVTHHDKDGSSTKFLALDKPLNRRQFLECLEVPISEEQQLKVEEDGEEFSLNYDPEWLAILKSTDFLTEITDKRVYMPGRTSSATDRFDFRPTKAEVEHVRALFNNDFKIPLNFRQTAPPLVASAALSRNKQSFYYRNPQSTEFCEKLGIRDLNYLLCQRSPTFVGVPHFCETSTIAKNSLRQLTYAMQSLTKNDDLAPILSPTVQEDAQLPPALMRNPPPEPEVESTTRKDANDLKNPEEIDIGATSVEKAEEEDAAAAASVAVTTTVPTGDEFGGDFFLVDAKPQKGSMPCV